MKINQILDGIEFINFMRFISKHSITYDLKVFFDTKLVNN
jgi:hypothetical protein